MTHEEQDKNIYFCYERVKSCGSRYLLFLDETTREETVDQDVPNPEVLSQDDPGDMPPLVEESHWENPTPQPANISKAKDKEVSSPLVTREKPKEIKIPLALRRLF